MRTFALISCPPTVVVPNVSDSDSLCDFLEATKLVFLAFTPTPIAASFWLFLAVCDGRPLATDARRLLIGRRDIE